MKTIFDKYHLSPRLPYDSFDGDREVQREIQKGSGRISISGVQPKYSMIPEGGVLKLAPEGRRGEYIAKPAPTASYILDRKHCPANEYLTMQIASRVYSIETAENGLCTLGNGEYVYVTKRFDVMPDGGKRAMEDLASVAGLGKFNGGEDYKYNVLSYEECAKLIADNTKSSKVEVLKFFRLVVYNFLTLNDDAHLKNFTLLEYGPGDYRLSPAYDLLNTSLHLAWPSIFALKKGLLREGMPERLDTFAVDGGLFVEFGKRVGLPDKLIRSELDRFCADYPEAEKMIRASALPDHLQESYLSGYNYRKKMLKWGR